MKGERRSGIRAVVVLGLLWGCQPAGTGANAHPPAMDPAPSPAASSPANLQPSGPPLQATIPLLGGGTASLQELRGRVVLLELSATDRPQWAAGQALYRRLVDELGDATLVVVSVAADPDARALRASWDRDKPPFVLGWDPQGALALRLGAGTLPTAFVLDSDGRQLARIDARDRFLDEVERAVRAAAAPAS